MDEPTGINDSFGFGYGRNCDHSLGVVSAKTENVVSAAVSVTAVTGKKWFRPVSLSPTLNAQYDGYRTV